MSLLDKRHKSLGLILVRCIPESPLPAYVDDVSSAGSDVDLLVVGAVSGLTVYM